MLAFKVLLHTWYGTDQSFVITARSQDEALAKAARVIERTGEVFDVR